MELASLLVSLPDVLHATGSPEVRVNQITPDSRRVAAGSLFVAYRGVGADGHSFIGDAIARGAAAVVGELSLDELPARPPVYVQVRDGRAALAWLSAAWYDHPSRAMALVGITGTDGKTTTANLLFNILRTAGRRAGMISTVSAVIGDQVHDTGLHTTTPDAPDIQRYLSEMRAAGAEIAVLEATSIGLAQHRLVACAFDVAVVTNITHEHLDAHGTYEAYREAKALLFRSLVTSPPKKPGLAKTAVLNRDDGSFQYMMTMPAERRITYGLVQAGVGEQQETRGQGNETPCIGLMASDVRHTPSGTEFDVQIAESTHHPATLSPGSPVSSPSCHLVTSLVGNFNVSNILAAMGAALALGVTVEAIREGVRAMSGIPGRMERIDCGQPFAAIVDFAHTPNGLAGALETLRTLCQADGRVIVVFGSAGLRDREKRRLMGQVAARLADLTVITAEDPRTEELAAIMAETAAALVAEGKVEGNDFARIPDRQCAILYAVQQARAGDVVAVCGKGHEQSMCFGRTEHPWRDQDALAWALEALHGRGPADPPYILPTWSARDVLPRPTNPI